MSFVPGDQTVYGNLTVAGTVTSLASKVPTDPFGDLRMVQRTSVMDLKSTFGMTLLRDSTTTAGSGSVTNTVGNAEYTVSVSAAGDSAMLRSVERGRYVSGYGAEMGIAVRLAQATYTGTQAARWGYFDDSSDGFYYTMTSAGLGVAYMYAGTETIFPRSSWNVDRLDGTGPSGATIDVTKGQIWQVVFSWYGYGAIVWRVVLTDTLGNQLVQVVHRWAPSGRTSIVIPNQPITVLLQSGTTAGALQAYVAGRQFSVLAYVPNPVSRITSVYRINQSLTKNTTGVFVPVISVQRKTGYLGNPVKISSLDFEVSADCLYQVRVNSTLTGASYVTPQDTPASETALQTDLSATALTGGVTIYAGLLPTGGKILVQTNDIMYSLNETSTMTVALLAFSANTTAHTVLRMSEGW
jgi:hypothetical protein